MCSQYARGRLHQHRETLAGGGRGTVPEALRDDDKFSSMVEDCERSTYTPYTCCLARLVTDAQTSIWSCFTRPPSFPFPPTSTTSRPKQP